MDRDNNDRYTIEYGKYGAYFFDNDEQEDMPLKHVLGMINHLERTRCMNK